MSITAQEVIQLLNLEPHPKEGGFFVETFRSKDNHSTAIFYLLTPDTFSELHRLPKDEVFHFYAGDPVTMLQLHPDGSSETITLGSDLKAGHQVQVLAPANSWQGSFLNEGGAFALLGCTVAPAFEYADYSSGQRDELVKQFPDQEQLILRLTHSDSN